MKRAQGGTGLIITGVSVIGGSHGAETRDASGVMLPRRGSLSAQAEAQIASSPQNASWRRSFILLDRIDSASCNTLAHPNLLVRLLLLLVAKTRSAYNP